MKTVTNHKLYTARGFSLIELLIVVAILAVLAAVIAPQFSGSTNEAKESALRSNLSSMRTAIAMYHREHNNSYPGVVDSSSVTACASGNITGGTGNSETDLINHLTKFSAADGSTCDTKDATYKFGPYLPAGIPINSVTNNAAVVMTGAGNINLAAGGTTGGWRFDYSIGKVIADHSTYQTW